MYVKNFVFCFLFFTNVINLAEEDILDNKNFSISTVEKNNLINKNNWNTRKWGNLYFLFPHVSLCNIVKVRYDISFLNNFNIYNKIIILLKFLFSGIIEYKYMFHKKCGVNIRVHLKKLEFYTNKSGAFYLFEPSLEWVYVRKGKSIFSGSFSLVGFSFMQKVDGDLVDGFYYKSWTCGFVLLKYEYDRRFYLNFGKIKTAWYLFLNSDKENEGPKLSLLYIFLSIEFGLNIIGVNDWRKKEKNK